MQNPFRHRNESDFARSNPDDDGSETRNRSFDEARSWNGGDGGRSAERFGTGQYARDGQSRGAFDQYGSGAQSAGDRNWNRDRQDYRTEQWDRDRYATSDYGRNAHFGQSSYDDRNAYGYSRGSQDNRAARNDYATHNYADGSQIWRNDSPMDHRHASRRDFEPDYLHWRNEQVSKFDRDYDDWRSERRQKFSSDFDTWRQTRADNPIVGNVSDGGVGNAKDAKKT